MDSTPCPPCNTMSTTPEIPRHRALIERRLDPKQAEGSLVESNAIRNIDIDGSKLPVELKPRPSSLVATKNHSASSDVRQVIPYNFST